MGLREVLHKLRRWQGMKEVSEEEMDEMHNLITKINVNSIQLNEDIRNLNNLVHVCMGDGYRFPEYRKE
jgi:hypothetical protein